MPAIPVPPDYTKQLDQIVRLLGRRQTPQWVLVVVGWVLGVAASLAVGWFNRRLDRSKLQRMLYREMARNYWQLLLLNARIMKAPRNGLLTKENPRGVLEFGAFEHAKAKRDVFESLGEVADIETMYELFHRCEELNSESRRTVFKLNPVLSAFKRRVGKEFSTGILLAVTAPPVRGAIERIVSDRKNEAKADGESPGRADTPLGGR